MAALGWLLNLDFAGSGAEAEEAPAETPRSRMLYTRMHALLLVVLCTGLIL